MRRKHPYYPNQTLYGLVFASLILIFSFAFVSSLSFNATIPDSCMRPGSPLNGTPPTAYLYNLYLDDFIDPSGFDSSDVVHYRGEDPLLSYPFDIPEGYFSLFDYCYETAVYGYPVNNSGLEIWSRNETCSSSDQNRLRICTGVGGSCSSYVESNTFMINVSSACPMPDCDGNDFDGDDSGTYWPNCNPAGDNASFEFDFDRLTLYYDFNEASGPVIDLTGNLNGTNNNADVQNSSGPNPYSYHFDQASSDHILIADNSVNSFGTDPFTINFWATNDETSYNGYAGKGATAPDYGWAIQTKNTGVLMFKDDAGNTICTGTTDTRGDGWHMFTVTRTNTSAGGTEIWVDGVVEDGCDSASDNYDDNDSMYIGFFSYGQYLEGNIDEFMVWNKSLNGSQILGLYNNGTGCFFDCIQNGTVEGGGGGGAGYPTLNTTVPDIYINYSVVNNWTYLNLTPYYSDFTEYFVLGTDPFDSSVYFNLCGYDYACYSGTLFQDYFDVLLGNVEPIINLYAYARPYTANFTIKVCNGDFNEYCLYDYFTFYINSSMSNVLLLDDLAYSYNTGSSVGDKIIFSGNEFFQYHENITFLYEDTNTSGLITSSFPFNYTDTGRTFYNDTVYQISFNCTVEQTPTNYTYLMDLNVTLECGDNQAYMWLGNRGWGYTLNFSMSASNLISTNQTSQGIVYAGTFLTGETTAEGNFSTDLNWTNIYDSFPRSEDDSHNFYFVMIVLISAFIGLFLFFLTLTKSIKFTLVGSSILTWLVMLFFSIGNYLPWSWTVTPPVVVIVYYMFKMIFGGGS